MEKGKNRLQASYHIDCKFLVQNWFILKNVIRLLSVRTRKLQLWYSAWIFQRICQKFKTRNQETLILKYFRSSSLSAFCKIGVLETTAKLLGNHICRRLKTAKYHGYFLYLSMNFGKELLRTPFYKTPPDGCFRCL